MIRHADPLNCEASTSALVAGVVTPNADFYVRNHFEIPTIDPSSWRIKVHGLVQRPLSLSLQDLQRMSSATEVVTLECAGNGRSMLHPAVEREQWGLGAVSTAEWTGVPLVEVLDRAGIEPRAREMLFRGADSGMWTGEPGSHRTSEA